jgi:hypothetical protein
MGKQSGGCACGQIRYEIAAEQMRMINCHCRDCQRASGSAYAAIIIVPAERVRLSGELRYHAAMSERHTRVERGFCPNCGSPVAGKLEARPDVLLIQAASLDDPSSFRPQANLWTRNAAPWERLDPSIPAFATTAA